MNYTIFILNMRVSVITPRELKLNHENVFVGAFNSALLNAYNPLEKSGRQIFIAYKKVVEYCINYWKNIVGEHVNMPDMYTEFLWKIAVAGEWTIISTNDDGFWIK